MSRVGTDERCPDIPAESRSRELIEQVPQWLAVHGLPLADRSIDHVVITPLAVLAVETAWWGRTSDEIHERRRDDAIQQAQHNARRLRSLLASRGFGFSLPVWPVVLTWGPGAEGTRLGLVDLVAGDDAAEWISAYRSGAIDPRVAEQVHAALTYYRDRFHEGIGPRVHAGRAA
jgi:hypothetical protein